MAFVDEAKIRAIAGDGGNGSASFHAEPYKPKGGPDGGDGGKGGSVVLRADTSVGTLLELRDHPQVKANSGGDGQRARRHGASGKDRIILVPPGTVVYEDDVLVADLASPGDELVAAQGGRGGQGNVHYATSTRQAPAFAQKGEPGETRGLRLELRLLADVGLVGFPNAGKSTLISRISAAKPKIASYPFTTLVPNLGVVKRGESSFVVADIPGLIEGASAGKGLGDRFLRHVRRAAVLVFLVDLTAEDRNPMDDVDVLRKELIAFDPELGTRPTLILGSKLDADPGRIDELLARHPDARPISAVTGEGVDDFVERVAALVEKARADTPPAVGYVRHVIKEDPVRVVREDEGWRIKGKRAERAVAVTDFENEEAIERLQRRLVAMGVERMLAEKGAEEGDEVRIGEINFDFEPEET